MQNKFIPFLLLLILLSACSGGVNIVPYHRQLVVEGHIENGQPASVVLSYSIGLNESTDLDNLYKHIIKDANVTISDGEKEEGLNLRRNSLGLPPFEYVSTSLLGEVGKTYHLTIEHKGKIITASTTIPKPIEIDSLWFVRDKEEERGHIQIRFNNESALYYQLSTRVLGEEYVFSPGLYGNINSENYPAGRINLQVNRGVVIFPKSNFTTYFPDTTVVDVKLSTQDEASFKFWKSYQNELVNSQNPIFPSTSRLESNINGGVGIWCGFGSNVERIDLNEWE